MCESGPWSSGSSRTRTGTAKAETKRAGRIKEDLKATMAAEECVKMMEGKGRMKGRKKAADESIAVVGKV